jgi:hypothetical protein
MKKKISHTTSARVGGMTPSHVRTFTAKQKTKFSLFFFFLSTPMRQHKEFKNVYPDSSYQKQQQQVDVWLVEGKVSWALFSLLLL